MAKLKKSEFVDLYNSQLHISANKLQMADVLFVTLGSAFAYFTKDEGNVVANCQKYPAEKFTKRLLPIQEITSEIATMLQHLRTYNPTVQLVFTVSPVRHIKDGVIENNRSKAHLLSAVHDLVDLHDYVHYFPSYELVMDDLRDYRFYNSDMLHPSDEAIDYIWKYFVETFFTSDTHEVLRQIESLNAAQSHRPLFPETESHKKFVQRTTELEKKLRQQYPRLAWSE